MVLNVVKWNPSRPSFGEVHSEHLAEFSWADNPGIDPFAVAPGSTIEAVWRCLEHGHPRVRAFYLKARNGQCPACDSLALKRPDVAAQWHPTRNGSVMPGDVSAGSMKKYWWVCEQSHPWQSSVANRTKIKNPVKCGVCHGNQVLAGYNDIASQRPEFAEQLHPTKNSLKPEEILAFSGKLYWWQCEVGHEWEQAPARRHITDCPVCSGRLLVLHVSDFLTTNPDIAAQWHSTLNSKQPWEITRKNLEIFWWLGPCGHEWESRVYDRVHSGTGCHYCAGYRVLRGFNDLATTRPEVLRLWDWERNELSPYEVTYGSNKKAHWVGSCAHRWEASIREVAAEHGTRCPYCSGHKLLTGFNDLATIAPHLVAEWHPTKNGSRTPETTMAEGKSKIWWLGACGHEWPAVAPPRIHRNVGCPKCKKNVSKIETKLFNFLKQYFGNAEQSVFVPLSNWGRYTRGAIDIQFEHNGRLFAVEYDGVYWHKGEAKTDADLRKTRALLVAGYQVIRVRENDLAPLPIDDASYHQFNFATKHDIAGAADKIADLVYLL